MPSSHSAHSQLRHFTKNPIIAHSILPFLNHGKIRTIIIPFSRPALPSATALLVRTVPLNIKRPTNTSEGVFGRLSYKKYIYWRIKVKSTVRIEKLLTRVNYKINLCMCGDTQSPQRPCTFIRQWWWWIHPLSLLKLHAITLRQEGKEGEIFTIIKIHGLNFRHYHSSCQFHIQIIIAIQMMELRGW